MTKRLRLLNLEIIIKEIKPGPFGKLINTILMIVLKKNGMSFQ